MDEAGSDLNQVSPPGQSTDRPDSAKSEPTAAPGQPGEVELAIVAGVFRALPSAEERLAYALARYVVLSRMEQGCRNIDLVTSLTVPGLFMVWEKWESHDHRRAHFEGTGARRLAAEVADLVAEPPQFDAFDGISAHDLA